MRFHFFYHVPYEGPGSLEAWIQKNGHLSSSTRFWLEESLPELNAIDFLIIMGGPMNIYEEKEYPWLKKEKDFIRRAIQARKKVLGICLGSQLIADVLGGKVYQNSEKEIGWMPVEWTEAAKNFVFFSAFPQSLTVLHWHGDTFHLPAGAIHLARSRACENQAFIYQDHVVGLQFHLEATPGLVRQFVENGKAELVKGSFIQSETEILSDSRHYSQINQALDHLLNHMVKHEDSGRTSQVKVSQAL